MRGGGQWPPYAFLNVDYDTLHFHTGLGSMKIHIFKVLLGGREGVTKKSTLCRLLIMLTIMDDPLLEVKIEALILAKKNGVVSSLMLAHSIKNCIMGHLWTMFF